nr:MAG TPA: hypothetical protein [Caudoviricetes sp.]
MDQFFTSQQKMFVWRSSWWGNFSWMRCLGFSGEWARCIFVL